MGLLFLPTLSLPVSMATSPNSRFQAAMTSPLPFLPPRPGGTAVRGLQAARGSAHAGPAPQARPGVCGPAGLSPAGPALGLRVASLSVPRRGCAGATGRGRGPRSCLPSGPRSHHPAALWKLPQALGWGGPAGAPLAWEAPVASIGAGAAAVAGRSGDCTRRPVAWSAQRLPGCQWQLAPWWRLLDTWARVVPSCWVVATFRLLQAAPSIPPSFSAAGGGAGGWSLD